MIEIRFVVMAVLLCIAFALFCWQSRRWLFWVGTGFFVLSLVQAVLQLPPEDIAAKVPFLPLILDPIAEALGQFYASMASRGYGNVRGQIVTNMAMVDTLSVGFAILGLLVAFIIAMVMRRLDVASNDRAETSTFDQSAVTYLTNPAVHSLFGVATVLGVVAWLILPVLADSTALSVLPSVDRAAVGVNLDAGFAQSVFWVNWLGLLFVACFWYLAGRPTEESDLKAWVKSLRKPAEGDPKLDRLHKALSSVTPQALQSLHLIPSEESERAMQAGRVEAEKAASKDKLTDIGTAWLTRIKGHFKAEGILTDQAVAQLTKASGAVFSEARVSKALVIGESFNDAHAMLIASLSEYARVSGGGILIVGAEQRLEILRARIQEFEQRYNRAVDNRWFPLDGDVTPGQSNFSCYATVNELGRCIQPRPGSQWDALSRRLKLIVLLDLQAMDMAHLKLAFSVLKGDVDDRQFKSLILVAQSEPIEGLEEAIHNQIIQRESVPLGFGMRRATDEYIHAFEDRIAGPNGAASGQMAALVKTAMAEKFAPHVFDPNRTELIGMQPEEVRECVGDPIQLPLMGGTADTFRPVHILRSDQNLASAVMSDLSSLNVQSSLRIILARPAPFNALIAQALQAGDGSHAALGALRRFLPRIPDLSGSISELAQDIIYRLSKNKDRLTPRDIKDLLTNHKHVFTEFGLQVSRGSLDRVLDLAVSRGAQETGRQFFETDQSDRHEQTFTLRQGINRPRGLVDGFVPVKPTTGGAGNTAEALAYVAIADRGLTYGKGHSICIDNTQYRIDDDGEGRNSDEVMIQRVSEPPMVQFYARSYLVQGAFRPDASATQAMDALQFGRGRLPAQLGQMRVVRASVGQHRYPVDKALTQAIRGVDQCLLGEREILRPAWHARALRFRVQVQMPKGRGLGFGKAMASDKATAAVKALCLTLEDVIALKFPAVAHRLAVVSEAGQTKEAQANSDRLVDHKLATIAVDAPAASEWSSPPAGCVDLWLIEDADHDLGVLQSLNHMAAVPAGNEIYKLWSELLSTAGKNPYYKPLADTEYDFTGAEKLLKQSVENMT